MAMQMALKMLLAFELAEAVRAGQFGLHDHSELVLKKKRTGSNGGGKGTMSC